MGRNAIDEDPENGFGGVYVGAVTEESVKVAAEKTDLVIMVRFAFLASAFASLIVSGARQVGSIASDFNSGEFSYPFKTEQTIELYAETTAPSFFHFPSLPSLFTTSLFPGSVADTLLSSLTVTLITHKFSTETTKAFLSTPFFPLSPRPSNPNRRTLKHITMMDSMSRSLKDQKTRWSSQLKLHSLCLRFY